MRQLLESHRLIWSASGGAMDAAPRASSSGQLVWGKPTVGAIDEHFAGCVRWQPRLAPNSFDNRAVVPSWARHRPPKRR